jgi:sterol desaturase/sphingolipid hydroxylase (fatty acid hydroxylase superfamily)
MAPEVGRLAVGLFVLAAVFGVLEWLAPAVPGQPRWRRDGATDVAYWFFTPLVTKTLTALAVGIALVSVALLHGIPLERPHLEAFLAPRGIVARQPGWLQAVEFLLLADLIAYWMHRWLHRPRLWPFHAVHHSSPQVDWLSAVRVHPVNDALVRVAQGVPLVLLGFDPRTLVAVVPVLLFYAIFVHANVAWSFGPFRYVIASPAFHRWHHAAEEQGLERNFAGLFPFFDLIFGTFHMPRGRQPKEFGIPGGDVPAGIWRQLRYPFERRHRLALTAR